MPLLSFVADLGRPVSIPRRVLFVLYWTKLHWGGFPQSISDFFFKFPFHQLLHIH
jgi:hypothetical protein